MGTTSREASNKNGTIALTFIVVICLFFSGYYVGFRDQQDNVTTANNIVKNYVYQTECLAQKVVALTSWEHLVKTGSQKEQSAKIREDKKQRLAVCDTVKMGGYGRIESDKALTVTTH